jgi:predicted GIY-YIG superfamily endonuclease
MTKETFNLIDIKGTRLTRPDLRGLICTYAIVNPATGQAYVGATQDFMKRWSTHCNRLKAGQHPNDRLQSAYAAHRDVLTISIVEKLFTTEGLEEAERDAAKPWTGQLYNYKVGNRWVEGESTATSTGFLAGGWYKPKTKHSGNTKLRWFDYTAPRYLGA